jgi:hypothetical protein
LAPLSEPFFAATPGEPAATLGLLPACFCVAVLGSTLLPAAGPDVVPLLWLDCANAGNPNTIKAIAETTASIFVLTM